MARLKRAPLIAVAMMLAGLALVSAPETALAQNATCNGPALGPAAGQQNVGGGATTSVACGASTNASGDGVVIAIGEFANASGVSVGADRPFSTSIGRSSNASGDGSSNVALGSSAVSNGTSSDNIAIGTTANAAGAGTANIAIGLGAAATVGNSVAIGSGATTNALANAVAVGQGSSATGANSVAGNAANGVQFNAGAVAAGSGNVVSFGAAGAARQLINVAAGSVNAASTDAVNGSQLFAVASNVQAAIAGNSAALGTSTAAAIGGGSTYQPATGTISAPNYQLNGSATTFNNVVAGQQAIAAGAAGPVQYSTPGTPSNSLQLVGVGGPVALNNVAAGTVAPGSLQAVNGGQLFGTASSVASALGGGSTVTAAGTVTAPTYNVAGRAYNDVGSALGALQGDMSRSFQRVNGGVAAAMAGSGIRYDDRPGKLSTGIGVAGWRGQAGIAAGLGLTSEDSLWRANVAVTIAPSAGNRTDAGVVGGLSYTWN